MKLTELKETQTFSKLLEELDIFLDPSTQLNEGVFDNISNGFKMVANVFSKVASSSGKKNSLNDDTIQGIYKTELAKTKQQVDELPQKVQGKVTNLLAKHGIKFGSVDLSRQHLNRIAILKVMRFIIFGISQMKDNGIEWILTSLATGGLGTIVSAIMAAKDVGSIAKELVSSSAEVKALFIKANQQTDSVG